ncbi:MAG TPA: amino acid ABC transporter permease [Burkholderiales bacterium]|nr:amino acid ABC transporter permease [Burkholderiales bacterium]
MDFAARIAALLDPDILRFLGGGLGLTLVVALGTIALSLIGGTALALVRLSPWRPASLAAAAYVETIRSLPSFLVLIYVYFATYRARLDVGTVAAVILGLTVYHSAKIAEVVRGGIQSIDRGQTEAARALGLGFMQAMASVVLPQAYRRMLPPLVSELVLCIKNTSIGSIVGLNELLRRGTIVYQQYFNPIEVLTLIALIYWGLCFSLSRVAARLEGSVVQRAERGALLRAPAAVEL